MRLRIIHRPVGTIDGVALDQFQVGEVYELGTQVACVFLAEGWAEVVDRASVVHSPPEQITIKGVVLVVDDDPSLRELAENLLTSQGYHVIVAQHGEDAIRRLREQCPDVIVLDLNMPVMDGWQFRSKQKHLDDARLSNVPVVLLTGAENAAEHAATLHARAFICKPFDPIALIDVIEAAVPARATTSFDPSEPASGDWGWRSLWRKRT